MKIILSTIVLILSLGAGYSISNDYLYKNIPEDSFERSGTANIANLIGSWQNINDSKSFKIFKESGTVQEIYAKKIVSDGTWELIEGTEEISIKGTFIKTLVNNEGHLYKIISATKSKLILSSLSRGHTFKYNRVP